MYFLMQCHAGFRYTEMSVDHRRYEEAQPGGETMQPFVRDGGLTFDLSRVHGEDFNTRIAWALRTGLEVSRTKPVLGRLVADLRSCNPANVIVGSVIKETLPYEVTSTAILTAAGVASWLDGASKIRNDFSGRPQDRSDLRVYIAPDTALQSCLEYLWHELLHLVSPYTHSARGGEASADASHVDEARWDRTMNLIALELPQRLVDPVNGKVERLQHPFAARLCRSCGRFA